MRPLLVFENIDTCQRYPLFTLCGVEWAATRYAWLSPFFWSALGALILITEGGLTAFRASPLTALAYGGLLYISNTVHSLGHIAAGKLVHAVMRTNLLTATRDVNLYPKGVAVPRPARLIRSLGGLIVNLLLGVPALEVGTALNIHWLRIFGLINLGVAAWVVMPVPTLDGWVLWRMLFGPRSKDKA